jgi:exonuclease VII small subunit
MAKSSIGKNLSKHLKEDIKQDVENYFSHAVVKIKRELKKEDYKEIAEKLGNYFSLFLYAKGKNKVIDWNIIKQSYDMGFQTGVGMEVMTKGEKKTIGRLLAKCELIVKRLDNENKRLEEDIKYYKAEMAKVENFLLELKKEPLVRKTVERIVNKTRQKEK